MIIGDDQLPGQNKPKHLAGQMCQTPSKTHKQTNGQTPRIEFRAF